MKKLLVILMAITICFSLVVVASAETCSGTGFDVNFTVDGQWIKGTAYGPEAFAFITDDCNVDFIIQSDEDCIERGYASAKDCFIDLLYNNRNTDWPDTVSFEETTISGYHAIKGAENIEENTRFYIIGTENYFFEIIVQTDENIDEFNSLMESIENMVLYSDVVGDSFFVEEIPVEDETLEDNKTTTDKVTVKTIKINNKIIVPIILTTGAVGAIATVFVLVLGKKKK